MGSNSSRIITDIILLLSIFILPWWLSLFLIVLSFYVFKPFYEGLFFALAIDLIYSAPRELFHNLPIIFIISLVSFLMLNLLGRQLRGKN